ncbi:PHD finger protein 3 isoform X2 [Gigaspora margarita]|uniref:Transcription factor BYE1 n=2 Tax=Gigaspora margarita TaxID=4874 RepID=A0A8H3XK98_GIGMA|nr:PHD finger protein 3 isoform X2 [Gigaspora margarita]
MESNDLSKYVNLPFGGEMDDNVVMSEEMGNVSMSQYINDTERHDEQSLGNLGGATIENGNSFTVEDLNFIHFDDFVHSSDTIAVTDGPQIIWNISATPDGQISSQDWNTSSLVLHDTVQTVQDNNTQSMLINPEAATQFLIDPTLMTQPQQPIQVQQGHSYGTRFANQMRPTPGIQPRQRRQRPKKGQGETDDGPYCICRGPASGVMVECDSCNEWFHCDCVNITPQQAQEVDKYHCPKCQVENPSLIGIIKDDCPMAEATGIDPKALLIEEPTSTDPPKPAKCLFKECSKPARENNPYCGESCLLHDKIMEIKMTKGPDVSQKASSPPAVTETKKGHRPVLPKPAPPTVLNGSSHTNNKIAPVNQRPISMVTNSTPTVIKSGSSQIKKFPIQQKKVSGGSGDSATKVRNLCLEKFQSLFAKKYDELSQKGELQNTQEGPEQLAQRLARRIEESIYDNFAAKTDKDGLGQNYKSKFRNLLTSLGHPKNEDLLMQVVKGDIPPVRLVMMSAEDLANPEQKSLMVKVRRESMQQSVLKADNGPRIKKTHKGEFIIIEGGNDSPKRDAPDANSTASTANGTFTSHPNTRPKINIEDLVPKRRASTTDGNNPLSASSDTSKDDSSSRRTSTSMEDLRTNFFKATPREENNDNQQPARNSSANDNNVFADTDMTGSPTAISVSSPMGSPLLSKDSYFEIVSKELISPKMSPHTPPGEPTNLNEPILPLTYIWSGKLVYDSVARFSGKASLVAAKKRSKERCWEDFLATVIRVNGHVSRVDEAETYLIDSWCSPSKDVAIIKFEYVDNIDDKQQFDMIFNYLRYSQKDRVMRYGRVANAYSNVREMYIIPLEPDDKVPDVFTFLDHDELLIPKNNEKRQSKLLLGAIVIVEAESVKTKRPRELNVNNATRSFKKEKVESAYNGQLGSNVQPNIGANVVTNSPVAHIMPPQTNVVMAPVNSPPNQQISSNITAVTSAPSGIFPGLLQSLLTAPGQNTPNQFQPQPQFNGPPPSGPPTYAMSTQPPPPQIHMPSQPNQYPAPFPAAAPPPNGQFMPPPHVVQGPPPTPQGQMPPPGPMPPGFPPQYEQFYAHAPPPPNYPPSQQPPTIQPQQQIQYGPPPLGQNVPPLGQNVPPPVGQNVPPVGQNVPPYHYPPTPSDNRRPGEQPQWVPPQDNRPWDKTNNRPPMWERNSDNRPMDLDNRPSWDHEDRRSYDLRPPRDRNHRRPSPPHSDYRDYLDRRQRGHHRNRQDSPRSRGSRNSGGGKGDRDWNEQDRDWGDRDKERDERFDRGRDQHRDGDRGNRGGRGGGRYRARA